MFKITLYRNGRARVYRFATLADARLCADAIFAASGIAVGIERTEG